MTKLYLLLSIFLLLGFSLDAQRISLLNPSFEAIPQHSATPHGWYNCGPPTESAPDILPEITFQVSTPPYAGNSYLGMVTRDNDTWESVGAVLTDPLIQGSCYSFQIVLGRSETYFSVSRAYNTPANYTAPTLLRIWGATEDCERSELLAESPTIEHFDWKLYNFILKPNRANYENIILEVYYPLNTVVPRNGNLLLDAASPFSLLSDCDVTTPSSAVQERGSAPSITIDQAAPSSSEVVRITGDTNRRQPSRSERARNTTNEPIVLQLPGAEYFTDHETLRAFAANILQDLTFTDDNQLTIQAFQLADETTPRPGHPAWYALQHALQFYADDAWELVIYTEQPQDADLRILELAKQLNLGQLSMNIVPYDADLYDGKTWFCMSIANGLYLLKRR